MPRKRHNPDEIIAKLRQVDALTLQGRSIAEAVKVIGTSETTYLRWWTQYIGMDLDQIRRLKALECENARLREALSDLTMAKQILAEAVRRDVLATRVH